MEQIGITERGDAALDHSWEDWVIKENKPAILITKNLAKLLDDYPFIMNNDNVIIHATITGLNEFIEPYTFSSWPKQVEALKSLADTPNLNLNRIVLRVDPIIACFFESQLSKLVIISNIVPRIRISFLDLYPHVKVRLQNKLPKNYYDAIIHDYAENSIHLPLEYRKDLRFKLEQAINTKVEVCGEPGMDCTGCVSKLDCDALNIKLEPPLYPVKPPREGCKCLLGKKELLNTKHPCAHGCLYCYWND